RLTADVFRAQPPNLLGTLVFVLQGSDACRNGLDLTLNLLNSGSDAGAQSLPSPTLFAGRAAGHVRSTRALDHRGLSLLELAKAVVYSAEAFEQIPSARPEPGCGDRVVADRLADSIQARRIGG